MATLCPGPGSGDPEPSPGWSHLCCQGVPCSWRRRPRNGRSWHLPHLGWYQNWMWFGSTWFEHNTNQFQWVTKLEKYLGGYKQREQIFGNKKHCWLFLRRSPLCSASKKLTATSNMSQVLGLKDGVVHTMIGLCWVVCCWNSSKNQYDNADMLMTARVPDDFVFEKSAMGHQCGSLSWCM